MMSKIKDNLPTSNDVGSESQPPRDGIGDGERSGGVAARLPTPEKERGRASHPLVELTLSRLREFAREPEVMFWVFIFPMLVAFALGIAFRNTEPEKIRVAVESGNSSFNGISSTSLAESLTRSGNVEVMVLSSAEASQALRSGRVALVIRAAAAPQSAPVAAQDGSVNDDARQNDAAPASFNYRFDPTRPESQMARLTVDDALQRALGRVDVTRAGEEKVIEPGARYIDFLIPGLIGMNLMGSGLWGVGFAVVMARIRNLLKRLAATPMRRSHYLLSFILSRLIFLVLEVAGVLIFARLVFGFRVQGSWASLSILLVLGALTFAGIGMLVAARPRTFEGVSGLMNLIMLPMWLLSGTFFSSSRFPEILQPFIKVLPLTALNDALRAVMNDGATLSSNWMPLCVLAAWAVISFGAALRFFRWQ